MLHIVRETNSIIAEITENNTIHNIMINMIDVQLLIGLGPVNKILTGLQCQCRLGNCHHGQKGIEVQDPSRIDLSKDVAEIDILKEINAIHILTDICLIKGIRKKDIHLIKIIKPSRFKDLLGKADNRICQTDILALNLDLFIQIDHHPQSMMAMLAEKMIGSIGLPKEIN